MGVKYVLHTAFIDINAAAMWGHSGGGFITADAMFRFPEFFKVGISESGESVPRHLLFSCRSFCLCLAQALKTVWQLRVGVEVDEQCDIAF